MPALWGNFGVAGMTEHCLECGSRKCNHGACPECNPCRHCNGGDRMDKYFEEFPPDDPLEQRTRDFTDE